MQVILSMILLSMRTMVIGYQYLTRDISKDSKSRAIESFMSQLGTVVYYINYAKAFYLCTLASKLFRDVFRKQLARIRTCLIHQQNGKF